MSRQIIGVVVAVVVVGFLAWFFRHDGPGEHGPSRGAVSEGKAPGVPDVGTAFAAKVEGLIEAELRVVGRVVGEGRRPAAGVEVVFLTRFAEPVRGRTDQEGRYLLPIAEFPAAEVLRAGSAPVAFAMIRALGPGGRAASEIVRLSEARDGLLEMPVLGLIPAHELVVRVEDATRPVAGAAVSLSRHARFALVRTDDDGLARLLGVPEGMAVVQAYHSRKGRAHARFWVTSGIEPTVLTLTRREMTVRTVRADSEEPVPEVPLDVTFLDRMPGMRHTGWYDPPMSPPTTDEHGVAVLVVGAEDRVEVYARAGPGPNSTRGSIRGRPVSIDEVIIRMPAVRTWAWNLVSGEVPPPGEGEVVRLLPYPISWVPPPAETATVTGGQLVIENVAVALIDCFALTADGHIARLRASTRIPATRDVAFRRQRRVEVTVRDEEGRPVEGVSVVVHPQSSNHRYPPGVTDVNGTTRIEKLHGGRCEIILTSTPAHRRDHVIVGIVDLDQGDSRIEYTLRRKSRTTLRFTCDGKPGLPTTYKRTGLWWVVEEDPGAGTLVVEHDREVRFRFLADGYAAVPLDLPAGGSPVPIDVALVSAGSVHGFVRASVESRSGGYVQRWDPEWERWVGVLRSHEQLWMETKLVGKIFAKDLAPGSYRLHDSESGLATVPVEVDAEGVGDLGVLDLTGGGTATGVVLGPEGVSVAGAQVLVVGEGLSQRRMIGLGRRVGAVGADGRFTVAVPGDRAVQLRVIHPTLRSGEGSSIEVREPTGGLVLRLHRGPTVRLRPQEAIEVGFTGPPRALFFSSEPVGEPVFERTCALIDGGLEFGAPPPGRYTLWISARPFAPLVRRGLDVGEESLDLGVVEFPVGSAVRVRILVGDGQAVPRLMVSAHSQTGPQYGRSVSSWGESVVTLPGLGAGRFRVSAMPIPGGDPGNRKFHEIEVDGRATTIHELEVDLR